MITFSTQSGESAQHYCAEDFRRPELFIQQPSFYGAFAERLGLVGVATESDFAALCANLLPRGSGRLSARTNTVRRAFGARGSICNRIAFYEFTHSAPKPFSLLALLLEEQRLQRLHERAVQTSLGLIQGLAATRGPGGHEDRFVITANLLAVLFYHHWSRWLDPQLHTHCRFSNATRETEGEKVTALFVQLIVADRPFFNEVYLAELRYGVRQLGFRIRGLDGNGIEEVPLALVRLFSRGQQAVAREVERLEKKGESVTPEQRKQIYLKLRPAKVPTLPLPACRRQWEQRAGAALQEMREAAARALDRGREQSGSEAEAKAAACAELDRAEGNSFARHSIRRERQILGPTLAASEGKFAWVHLRDAWEDALGAGRFVALESGGYTSEKVRRRDRRLVARINETRGASATLGINATSASCLAADPALLAIARSRDLITFVKELGAPDAPIAKRLERGLGAHSWGNQAFLPEGSGDIAAQAEKLLRPSDVIVLEGAQFLEADLLEALLARAQRERKQIILVGDGRKSDSLLYTLRTKSRLAVFPAGHKSPAARLRATVRERHAALKLAVAAGDGGGALDLLGQLGAIVELPEQEMVARIAKDYLHAAGKRGQFFALAAALGKTCRDLNDAIRAALVGTKVLRPLCPGRRLVQQASGPEFTSSFRYEVHDLLLVPRQTGGLLRGYASVVGVNPAEDRVIVQQPPNLPLALDLRASATWELYRPVPLLLAAGEQLVMDRFISWGKRKFRRDEIVTVSGIKNGNIHFRCRRSLPLELGFFSYGYALPPDRVVRSLRRPEHLLVLMPPEPLAPLALLELLRFGKASQLYTANRRALLEAVDTEKRRREIVADRQRHQLHRLAQERLAAEVDATPGKPKALMPSGSPSSPQSSSRGAALAEPMPDGSTALKQQRTEHLAGDAATGQSSTGKTVADQTQGDMPVGDKVSSEKVGSDKVGSDKVGSDKVGSDKVSGDKVSGDKVSGDKVSGDKVSGDKVSGDKVSGDKVSGDKVSGDKVSGDKVSGDKVGGDKVGGDKVGGDKVGGDKVGGVNVASEEVAGATQASATRRSKPKPPHDIL